MTSLRSLFIHSVPRWGHTALTAVNSWLRIYLTTARGINMQHSVSQQCHRTFAEESIRSLLLYCFRWYFHKFKLCQSFWMILLDFCLTWRRLYTAGVSLQPNYSTQHTDDRRCWLWLLPLLCVTSSLYKSRTERFSDQIGSAIIPTGPSPAHMRNLRESGRICF